MFEIRRYSEELAPAWNEFVARSKNGTFLFDRRYMDYHADRFNDHSLLLLRDNRLYALLPANAHDGVLYSHQGLTYGGFVMGEEVTAAHMLELLRLLNDYLAREGFGRVVYKAVPSIYHRVPAEEDLYAIHHACRYRLLERDISSTVVPAQRVKWKKDRLHGVKKALANGIVVEESEDYGAFWQVLADNLMQKHGAKPVHSLEEIRLLHRRFPRNIVLYTARQNQTLLGGCVLYVANSRVVHAQYISATPEGKRLGAIDLMMLHLLNEVFSDIPFFDLGTSVEVHSDQLNESLIYQKEGFGGRALCYDTYEWTL